jgi:hypothetical protein
MTLTSSKLNYQFRMDARAGASARRRHPHHRWSKLLTDDEICGILVLGWDACGRDKRNFARVALGAAQRAATLTALTATIARRVRIRR